MRCLIIDTEGMCLDLVLRAVDDGHDVRWMRGRPDSQDGDGFRGFKIVPDWQSSMKWVGRDGLIIPTGNDKYMAELDRYREHGYEIFGPTKASAALEINRGYAMEQFEKAGIDVPPFQTFKTLEETAKFARKSDDCWVFKTLGDEDDKSLTFVSCSPAEMVGWIERQMKRGKKLKGPFMLQEKVEADFEIGINGWFGPEGFLPEKYQISFEHKPLMPGDIGPNTGESVSISQYVETDKLVDELLTPLVPILKKTGHRGDFCIGAMIDKKGKAWPLEATARLGYPAIFGQIASHKGDVVQWMRDLLDGEDTLKVSRDVCSAVVMGQPKYPYNVTTIEEGTGNPIMGIEDADDDVHPVSVMIANGPKMEDGSVTDGPICQTAGGEIVMVVTALGKTIEKSRATVYETIDKIKFPNAIYRNDAGVKVEDGLSRMHEAGFALGLS